MGQHLSTYAHQKQQGLDLVKEAAAFVDSLGSVDVLRVSRVADKN